MIGWLWVEVCPGSHLTAKWNDMTSCIVDSHFGNPVPGEHSRLPHLFQHWQRVLSLRPRSVLLSFGSMVRSANLRLDVKRAFLKVRR